MMRTYFDKTTGAYIGIWNWPATEAQANHPALAGHAWLEGQVGGSGYRLNLSTGNLDLIPVVPAPDWDGFLVAAFEGCVDAETGTPEERADAVSNRMDNYPSFVTFIQSRNLVMVQRRIAKAQADYLANPTTGIPPAYAAAIQAAMVANHLVVE